MFCPTLFSTRANAAMRICPCKHPQINISVQKADEKYHPWVKEVRIEKISMESFLLFLQVPPTFTDPRTFIIVQYSRNCLIPYCGQPLSGPM